MKKTKKYIFSKVVSRIFDVPVVVALLFGAIVDNAPVDYKITDFQLVMGLVLLVLMPIFAMLFLIKIGAVDNWELTNKNKRKHAYGLGFVYLLILISIGHVTRLDTYYRDLLYLILFVISLYGVVTNFTPYKLSLHVSSWTMFMIILVFFYGPVFLILIPLILLVAYARYTIKNHTIPDMLLGAITISIISLMYIISL